MYLATPGCPQATRERADRVYSQRFFCVDRTRTGEITEEFKVLGSTGNVYTINVDKARLRGLFAFGCCAKRT